MDANDNKPVGTGRGALILKLLKAKKPEGSNLNLAEVPSSSLPHDFFTSTKKDEAKPLVTDTKVVSSSQPLIAGSSGNVTLPFLKSQLPRSDGRGLAIESMIKSPIGRPIFARGRGIMVPKKTFPEPAKTLDTIITKAPASIKSEQPTTNVEQELKDLQLEEMVTYSGSSGNKFPVKVNCVKVKCENKAVYQYHVSFEPVIDSKNQRFHLLNRQREVIGNTKAFDGSILYLPIRLKTEVTTVYSTRATDNVEVKLVIRLTKLIDPASHLLIPFYNNILKRCMSLINLCPVGRNYYDPHSPTNIPKLRLVLWPGYVTSIKNFEAGLLLNIDVSHKVLRQETARHMMADAYKKSPSTFREDCIKELVGAIVLTRYNNKNYRIDDISWDTTPTSTFTNSKGETLTFQEYYKVQYKLEIRDLKQPMLVHRPKRRQQDQDRREDADKIILLVPELCSLTGLSDKMRSDFRVMKDIRDNAQMNPTQRNEAVEKFIARINGHKAAKDELLKWGLEIEAHTSETHARTFPPEKVMVGHGQVFSCGPEADFTREVTRSPIIRPVHLRHWVVVFTRRDARKARDFIDKLQECTRKLGVELSLPRFVEIQDDRNASFKEAISSSYSRDLQLVVCIFPTSRDDRYSAVKKLCCVDMPVPSQVIISRTLPDDKNMGKFRSVTMKIALQINCKLGGELWAVDVPLKGLMVCGIDVYHEPGGKGRSVGAFVASCNKLMTRWFSKAVFQKAHQELMDALKPCFTESVKKYYEVNHSLPERIVLYRDGVGDGQLKNVSEYEVGQLQSSLKMFDTIFGAPYRPKLTVVVVSKRINIRFFGLSRNGFANPPPGSVLDHFATRPNWPDFFLVSQNVRHSAVSPTHYIVVSGHEHLKPDHMQRLSYKMTYMYYNWPGTVKVPAPCQYAHKLAYLVGQSLRQVPSTDLSDKLFYL